MTFPVVHPTRSRVYVRRFDHDQARTRHAEGETVRDLAAEYGVTAKAVWQAVTPEKRAARNAYRKAWRTGVCEDCGGPAMRLVGKLAHNKDGLVLCNACRGVRRRKQAVVQDGVLSLECGHCKTVKPLATFSPRVRRALRDGRPLRRATCSACETAARQAYRERHKQPCVGCGKPALPPNEKGPRGAAVTRCRACFYADDRARRNGNAA